MTAAGSSESRSIGRYELRAILGVGGFATVHRAYDTALDAHVAAKILLPQFADNTDVRSRFVQEAKLLRRVDSPNVVKVHDIGELDDGRPYFVMELALGGSLRDRLSEGAGRESLSRIVHALADGLGALHAAGVVHRDIKPDNLLIAGSASEDHTQIRSSLLADDERLVISDLGLAKDQDRTSVGPTIAGGTPHFRSPEQMEVGATITPATDVYAATGVLWNVITNSYPPETSAVAGQLPSLPAAWQSMLERGLQRDPTLRHGSMAEWADDARRAIAASPETRPINVAVGDVSSLCPYKGMAAFQPEDAGLFFGRDELIDTLIARLQDHPVLVIGGPSGSGKSSLLRAGLIPRLERGAIAGSQQWRVALFNPGSDAVGELLHHVTRMRPDATDRLRREDLPHGARRYLDDGQSTLIAIDQFEELFTLNSSRAGQELFLDTLAAMTESVHSRIRVAIALRADFYGTCAGHPWLADRINEAQVLVGPMSRSELREAIISPAQRAGLHVEEGLADAIVSDVGPGVGGLPLVGHALMETWLRRRGSLLTLEGYQAAGTVSGAIAQRAEHVCEQLSEGEQETARRLLLRLTNPGEGTPDTRRRVPLSELQSDGQMAQVIDKLASARLLTVDDGSAEVAHEALLQSWPRLRRWIDDDRENLRTRRRIGSAATEWAAQDRPSGLLYRGTPLASALEWYENHPGEIDPIAVEFLESSRHERDEQEAERRSVEARSRRNRRLAVSALAVLAVAAVAASLVAFAALRRSQMNEEEAQLQQVQALAAAASGNVSTQPLLATALALESIERSDPSTAAARDALVEARAGLDATRWLPQPYGNPVPVGDALSVAITRDGDRFVTGSRTGDVVFWNRTSRLETHRFDVLHDGGIEDFDVSLDGRWLISAGGSRAYLWDLDAEDPFPELFVELDGGDAQIWNVAFSPDSRLIAISTESDGAPVFDRETGQLAGEPFREERLDLLSVVFLDARTLAIGDGLGGVWVVDVESGETVPPDLERPMAEAGSQSNDVWELVLNPDRTLLLTASDDNTTKAFHVSGRTLEAVVDATVADLADPAGLVLSRHGTELVVGDSDGRMHRVVAETGELIPGGVSISAHTDRISDAAISDNGWMVSLGDDQRVQVWRFVESNASLGVVLAELGPATAISLSPSARWLAIASDGATVVVEAQSGAPVVTLPGAALSVEFVDEDLLVTGTEDGELVLWQPSTGSVRSTVTTEEGASIRALAVSPDGTLIATGADDGSVLLWSSETLALEQRLDHHGAPAYGVAFLPDGGTVASVGFDGRLRLSPADGGTARSVVLDQDGPRTLAVHPSGELIAIGGGQERIDVIDLDGEWQSSMATHPGGVWDVAFTNDGLSVIGTGLAGAIQLWDWETGERLGPAFGFHPRSTGISTGPTVVVGPTDTIWSAGPDGTVRKLDALDEGAACQISSGVLSDTMRQQFLNGAELASCRIQSS